MPGPVNNGVGEEKQEGYRGVARAPCSTPVSTLVWYQPCVQKRHLEAGGGSRAKHRAASYTLRTGYSYKMCNTFAFVDVNNDRSYTFCRFPIALIQCSCMTYVKV